LQRLASSAMHFWPRLCRKFQSRKFQSCIFSVSTTCSGSLAALLDAVVGSPSVRELALADNFVVCSCKWLRVVQRLAAADVVIIDWLDAAPRCSEETVRRCRATNDRTRNEIKWNESRAVWLLLRPTAATAVARLSRLHSVRPSVRLSVSHTSGSVKNDAI